MPNVLAHPCLNVHESVLATGRAQFVQVRLSKALVFASQGNGEINVLNELLVDRLGKAQGALPCLCAVAVDHTQRHIVEGLSAA